MSDFTDLIDRGTAWLEGKVPCTVTISGTSYTALSGNVTEEHELRTGYIKESVSRVVAIRRALLEALPTDLIGKKVTVAARGVSKIMRVDQIHSDEAGHELYLAETSN